MNKMWIAFLMPVVIQ